MTMAGQPLNFGDEWVLIFHRVGDKVQLVRRNVHFKAPSGTPIEKAVKQNYTDSILMALPIVSINPGGGMSVLIDLADIFLTDFAQLRSATSTGAGRTGTRSRRSPTTSSSRSRRPSAAAAAGVGLRRRRRDRRPRRDDRRSTTAWPSCPTAAITPAPPTTASATS